MKNPYVPYAVRIEEIASENAQKDIKTFTLAFLERAELQAFRYLPGQFAELSVFGHGECPIGIASSPTESGILRFTVKKAGAVTTELHNSEPGRVIGVRGPLGNTFPWEQMRHRNVVIVGGGFAFTTLRAAAVYILDPVNRACFNDVTVVYGARGPGELMYKGLLEEWGRRADIRLHVTVDKGDPSWHGREGFVPAVLEHVAPSRENAIALVCGPPVMIKFTIPVLRKLGFDDADIYLSLEMRMKCGIGKCGRCNIGNKYVCIDGPVFSYRDLAQLPQEF